MSKSMNYPTFLKEVDRVISNCDMDSLRQFVHDLARKERECKREEFFDTLVRFCGVSEEKSEDKKAEEKSLADKIDEVIEALDDIQSGNRNLIGSYVEEYDDWDDYYENEYNFEDPEDILSDVQIAINLIHTCLDHEEYAKGAELALRLSKLRVQVTGDYEDYEGECEIDLDSLLYKDLISGSREEIVKECVYLACLGNDEENSAEAMVTIIDNFNGYRIKLDDILRMGSNEIDLNTFLPHWIKALAKRALKADDLLVEAQDMLQDKDIILANAHRYAQSHPILYKNILSKGLKDTTSEEMLQIGLRGIKEVSKSDIRSDIALLTAKYALEEKQVQIAEECWLEAFRSSVTIVNYLRLRLESRNWGDYAEEARRIYMSYYKKVSSDSDERAKKAMIMFFDGRFEEVINQFMNPEKGIGWSYTFMKQGIALCLMLLVDKYINGLGLSKMKDRVIEATSFSVKSYCEGTNLLVTRSNADFFQKCFDKWKTQVEISEDLKRTLVEKIKQWIAMRVESIISANRRNYYEECASFISAYGEVLESLGHRGAKKKIMLEYKSEYPRRSAFHRELRLYGMGK